MDKLENKIPPPLLVLIIALGVYVASGIFKISRNPMYVGMTFLLLSWSLFLSSPYTFTGALIFILYINRFQIEPEERALRTLFGFEFENYCLKVRRWL
jgi:protein-S-isoprenylcysteine O-methyltransferase Ste14